MTVAELIRKLQQCPFPQAEIAIQIDGGEVATIQEVEYYQDPEDCVYIAGRTGL